MINQLTMLIVVLAIVWIVIFQKREKKIDLLQIFMENDKPSYIRFGSFVCLWLFVWIVKRSVGIPAIEVNIELIVIVGILTFFPKLFQKFVEGYIQRKNK